MGFVYTKSLLRLIAENYLSIYDGLPFDNYNETNLFHLAEFKSDIDMALNELGKFKHWWKGEIDDPDFNLYKRYNIWQRLIISDILHLNDSDIQVLICRNAPLLKGKAYSRLQRILNG